MFGRSSAFRLTRSLTVVAIGLVGATQALPRSRPPDTRRLTPQDSGTTQGLIAVSPVNKRVVWASGRGGTFAVTTNGGTTWRSGVVPGAESLRFRDVEGVSDTVAYLLSIGTGSDSRIYKTTDGGTTWSQQFQNQDPAAFSSCFAFWTPTRGLPRAIPERAIPVVRTTNGWTWGASPATSPRRFPASSSSRRAAPASPRMKRTTWAVTGGASPSRVLVTATAVIRGTPRLTATRFSEQRACSASPSGTGSTGWWAAEISINGPAVRSNRDL